MLVKSFLIRTVYTFVNCFFLFRIQTNSEGNEQPYPWKSRERYYYPTVDKKMEEILDSSCLKTVHRSLNGIITMPESTLIMKVTSLPVDKDIISWWRRFPKPKQMRVDPFLCDAVYSKRMPIFNNTGCQLPGYMNPSSPRCQTKYLKWACDNARIPMNSSYSNSFVLPESDHSTIDLPPQPWILTVRHSFVSMCGHISSACGLVHTTANCQAIAHETQATAFHKKCQVSQIDKVRVSHIRGSQFSEYCCS